MSVLPGQDPAYETVRRDRNSLRKTIQGVTNLDRPVSKAPMKLIEYFDRTSIIHLPDRVDRFLALEHELKILDTEIHDPKIEVPFAPRPDDANGYSSRGVFGSFLSHYEILKKALNDGLESVWVLEDDAIFSRRLGREQEAVVDFLQKSPWEICYLGHTLRRELVPLEKGLIRYSGPFYWAHCYAVHRRVLPRLVAYLEETMSNPPGHPRGGRVYIDAAYSLFRQLYPDVVSLVANPVMSRQKGCLSSLGGGRWYDRSPLTRPLVSLAREARDECWRRTGLILTPGP